MTALLDAGIGGLFLLKALIKQFPKEQFIYLADQKHFPYGDKPAGFIRSLLKENVHFLVGQGAKRVIVACNTASAVLEEESAYPVPVTGVILASLKQAEKESLSGQVGLLATRGTVRSQAFLNPRACRPFGLKIYQQACPLLAPFVEQEGWKLHSSDGSAKKKLVSLLDQYIPPLLNQGVDTIIMACTHYLYLKPFIEEYLKGAALDGFSASKEEMRQESHASGFARGSNKMRIKVVGPVEMVIKDLVPVFQKEDSQKKDRLLSSSGLPAFPVSLFVSGPHQETYKSKCLRILKMG